MIAQHAMTFLISQGLSFHFHRTEPCPEQWRWIFVSFEQIPDEDALFLGDAESLRGAGGNVKVRENPLNIKQSDKQTKTHPRIG